MFAYVCIELTPCLPCEMPVRGVCVAGTEVGIEVVCPRWSRLSLSALDILPPQCSGSRPFLFAQRRMQTSIFAAAGSDSERLVCVSVSAGAEWCWLRWHGCGVVVVVIAVVMVVMVVTFSSGSEW